MLEFAGMLLLALVAFLVVEYLYLVGVVAWTEHRTIGGNYYLLSVADRRRFKRQLALHRLLVAPIVWLLARLAPSNFGKASVVHNGVRVPRGTCTPASLERGMEYRPRAEDVFVVTQMRSGTTLTQHLVFQVLERGRRDLVQEDRTLQSVSAWIEAARSVAIDDASTVGADRPGRILKTHLGAAACPFDASARYVYVVRHPVSCFASCVDYLRTNLDGFAPGLEEMERWFLDPDAMWWGAWADHLAGWWDRAQQHENVLLIRFEDLRSDLATAARSIAAHLGCEPLTESEMDAVLTSCSFQHMREHFEFFEMTPPHLFQDGSGLFVSGRSNRKDDVDAELRGRVASRVRARLDELGVPWSDLYPDLGETATHGERS